MNWLEGFLSGLLVGYLLAMFTSLLAMYRRSKRSQADFLIQQQEKNQSYSRTGNPKDLDTV